MTSKPVAKSSLKIGDKTVLGTIASIKVSPSGETMTITVTKDDGSTFTDRISTLGNMYVFTS